MKLEGVISKMAERAKKNIKTIALPESEDVRILKAASIVAFEKIAKIVLIGNKEEILKKCDIENIKIDHENIEIIDPILYKEKETYAELLYELRKGKGMTLEEAKEKIKDNMYFSTTMAKAGDVDGVVSGATHSTADTLRPALQIVKAAQGINSISTFFLMETDKKELGTDGILLFSDCGLIEFPTKEQLVDITIESAKSYRMLTGNEPKVALLSYSTKGSAKSDAIDKMVDVLKLLNEKDLDFDYDGEFQLDAALVLEVAKIKAPESKVAGHANVLIFPNLEAGNIAYKMAQRFGDTLALGPVTQGLNKPINDLSRGSSVNDIVGTIIITCLQA